MELVKNTLVRWRMEENRLERILWILPGRDEVGVIEMERANAHVQTRRHADVIDALKSGEAYILNEDRWQAPLHCEPSERDKEIRDNRMETIKPLVDAILSRNKKEIRKARKDALSRFPISQVYKFLRLYFRRGQYPNALLPIFENCGAPGKSRIPKPGSKNSARRKDPKDHIGRLLPLSDREKLRQGFKNNFSNEAKLTLKAAYEKTLVEYFSSNSTRIVDGIVVPNLLPVEERPSYRQFRYHTKDLYESPDTRRARLGERKDTLLHREQPGRFLSNGPGDRYFIDSTPADIKLVADHDEGQSVSRPTLYLIIDHFSRLIVGFYFGLENASARCAGTAMAQAAFDKVEFCRSYEIEIEPQEWPCHHLPKRLGADQGELRGPIAEPWIEQANIEIDQMPSYRGDLKGLVERCLKSIQEGTLKGLPGYMDKDRCRGDRNPDKEAKLTEYEVTRLIIYWIIEYNNSPVANRERLNLPKEAGVTPAKIWEWGITHRGGSLTKWTPANILPLLYRVKGGSITKEGILFKNIIYTCATAEKDRWFVSKVGEKVKCRYDPNNAAVLYIEDGKSFEKCQIRHANDFAWGKSWKDIERERKEISQLNASAEEEATEKRITRSSYVNSVLKSKSKKKTSSKNTRAAQQRQLESQRMAAAGAQQITWVDDSPEETAMETEMDMEMETTAGENHENPTERPPTPGLKGKRLSLLDN